MKDFSKVEINQIVDKVNAKTKQRQEQYQTHNGMSLRGDKMKRYTVKPYSQYLNCRVFGVWDNQKGQFVKESTHLLDGQLDAISPMMADMKALAQRLNEVS